MRLGVLSDIHDALKNLDSALSLFNREGVETLLFCGDFCSPIPCRVLKAWPGTVHAVFGNGDGDRWQMRNIASSGPENLILHGEYADIRAGGRRIGLTHYPFYAHYMARSGDFDAVFSGHTHEAATGRFGSALWANPGDVMGWKNPASVGLYDTVSGSWEQVVLS